MNYHFSILFFALCSSLFAGAQDLTSPNLKDSLGLKTGEWTETDTLATEIIALSLTSTMTTKGCIESQGPSYPMVSKSVCISKGNYTKGLKSGIWKYYRDTNKFYKQVTYRFGHIQKVEIIYRNGQWQLIAVVDQEKKVAHFTKYDMNGKVENEGEIPIFLLYSSSMDLH
ncbi:MAG: hypothetical protein ACO1G9_13055 [Bacteroidota bacterium]